MFQVLIQQEVMHHVWLLLLQLWLVAGQWSGRAWGCMLQARKGKAWLPMRAAVISGRRRVCLLMLLALRQGMGRAWASVKAGQQLRGCHLLGCCLLACCLPLQQHPAG